MHELSITQDILRIATEEARRHQASQIKVIRLKVGALTQVAPESVQFYLDALSTGTIAEGAKLEAIPVPVGATCTQCGSFFLVRDYELACASCGGMGKITQGKELFVESLEVEA